MVFKNSLRQIGAFLALTFTGLLLISFALAGSGGAENNMGLALILMWLPGLAAIAVGLIFNRNLRGLGWKPGKIKYLALSYLLPLVIALITYSVIWLSGLGKFHFPQRGEFAFNTCGMIGIKNPSFGVALAVMLTWGLILRLIFALGEEIGWRGFLISRLAELDSAKKIAVISGAAWFLFHLPGLLFLDYYRGSRFKSFIFFAIMIMSASVIMLWLRLKSGSLWTGAIFHASHNLAIQGIFNALTRTTGNTNFFIDEFGLGMALSYTLVALYFWKRLDSAQQER